MISDDEKKFFQKLLVLIAKWLQQKELCLKRVTRSYSLKVKGNLV